jgi:hypothetical protein
MPTATITRTELGPETLTKFTIRDLVAFVLATSMLAGVYWKLDAKITAVEVRNTEQDRGSETLVQAIRELNGNVKELTVEVAKLQGAQGHH